MNINSRIYLRFNLALKESKSEILKRHSFLIKIHKKKYHEKNPDLQSKKKQTQKSYFVMRRANQARISNIRTNLTYYTYLKRSY